MPSIPQFPQPIPSTLPNIFGAFDSRDVVRPLYQIPQPDLYVQMKAALDYYNKLADAILSLLTTRTTLVMERFGSGVSGGLLQPGAEFGRALATRDEATAFDVAYPIDRFRDRAMFTPEYLLRATLPELNARTINAFIKDYNTLFRTVLGALFDNTNYTFFDDKILGQNAGNVTVRRLANADGSPGSVFVEGSSKALGTLNHYKTSGSGTVTTGAFTMVRDTLRNVGMDSDIVVFISRLDQDAVRALPDFVEAYSNRLDPNIVYNPLTEPTFSIVQNPEAIGRIKNIGEVIILPWMPQGYFLGMDRGADAPLVIRESDVERLRGFRLTGDDVIGSPELDGPNPILNKYWERIFGVGVRNRVNGVIVQITASGTYTAPNFFA